MKKALFLTLAVLLLPMAMSAQLLGSQEFKFHHMPYALKSFTPRMMAPARADLADNQKIMGHYDTDDLSSSDEGLGITGMPGVLTLSTIISPAELSMFQGGKIVKFRVGLAQATTISRVFVAPALNAANVGTITEWTCSANAAGWNEIELETPYEINLEDGVSLMIGFDYQQTDSNYPISAVEVGDIYPTYLYYNGSWEDVGLSAYGNLGLQCVVESDHYPDYMIMVSKIHTDKFIKLGDDINYKFFSRNMGVAAVPEGACTYDVLIDGELVTTIENPVALSGSDVDITGTIPSTGLASGKHTLTVTVNSVNGEPVEVPISTSTTFTIYVNGFPHQMHLIEQFTSTYCTYCPLGNSMLTILTGLRDDLAWVGIHGNMNGTDPMRTLQCDTIMAYQGSNSYPSGSFDRATGWESDEEIVTGLGYNASYHQMVAEAISAFFDELDAEPAFATVNINSTIDPDTREAVITIDGELTPDFDIMMGADSKLTVYITEDGVSARQLNNGRWVNGYIHNGVLRRALYSAMGNDLKRDGDTYKNEFTYTIPSSWNIDNLNVVAFISRPLRNGATGVYTDMFVNQANKRKLGEFDVVTIVRGDANGDDIISIEDVTTLIDALLSGTNPVNPEGADCDQDGSLTIGDVTTLIDYLLSGVWPE